MDPHSILDPSHTPDLAAPEKLPDGPGMQANDSTAPEIRFPGEDGGKSLAGMAQKDLTATLQLLAEQAQYITGASGAAIALRDEGEMVCRASAGPSAPEVGSLLQVDSGLSGESVRTRQTLRCDDAATDPRVNRESCEALGIASVVVMPLVQGNEVIGVFELFSDKAHVFQGRDITALERMGTMVFTVLEQAMAAHGVTIWPERGNGEAVFAASEAAAVVEVPEISAATDATAAEHPDSIDETSSGGEIAPPTGGVAAVKPSASPEIPETVSGIAFHGPVQAAGSSSLAPTAPSGAGSWQDEGDEILGDIASPRESSLSSEVAIPTGNLLSRGSEDEGDGEDSILDGEPSSSLTAQEKQASLERPPMGGLVDTTVPTRSAVASLRKCETCGFPISEGRRLCLDCEKKQAQAGNAASSTAEEVGRASDFANGSGQLKAVDESDPGTGPQFLRDDQEDASWLASHKYMVVAILIAVIIIVALLLAH